MCVGDQKDRTLLKSIVEKFGQFDIVVDDASHLDFETKVTFKHIFPYLKSGAPYIIEDLHAGEWKKMKHIMRDIKGFNEAGEFLYLDHEDMVKSTVLVRMAFDLGLSKSLLPPHGNGASDFGIILRK